MAIADMFLKLTGVTGEVQDADHKGEIEVVSWSWGMLAPTALGGTATGRASLRELSIAKRVDAATPTLMMCLRSHRVVPQGKLTVRKAGTTPLEYFKIELTNVRITSLVTDSDQADLIERLKLGFHRVTVTYTPQQGGTGASGGGAIVFEADAQAAT